MDVEIPTQKITKKPCDHLRHWAVVSEDRRQVLLMSSVSQTKSKTQEEFEKLNLSSEDVKLLSQGLFLAAYDEIVEIPEYIVKEDEKVSLVFYV